MNSSYTQVVCLFLFLSGINKAFANTSTLLSFNCPTDTLSFCVEDEGVRPPASFSLKNLGTYTIDGYIRSVKGKGIPGVVVRIEDSHQAHPSVLTDSAGHYITSFSEDGKLITITPEKTDNPKAGISTLDLVRIQKHLLGQLTFTTPYEYISADANNSQTVSAIDLVELRKLILGIYTELPNNQSWRFVATNFQLDPHNPWPYPGSRTVLVDQSIYDINFIGIKIGDVSSSTPFTSDNHIEIRNSMPEILWSADQQTYQRGDEIEIEIRTNNNIDLQGFQLTISSPDLLFKDVSSANLALDESTYFNFGDKMTMSWFDENGIELSKGDVVFTLKAIATQSGNLKNGLSINSEITEAEVYSMQDEIFTPQLLIHDDSDVNTPALMPNPWKEQTTIAINLKEEGITKVEIMDLNGRSIYTETKYLLKGNNEIVLESKNFEARGLLMYSIKNGNEALTAKMIVID